MDNILPFTLCCFGPILWGLLWFTVGRYSATHTIELPRIKRRGEAEQSNSPFYENFQEDR